MSRLTFKDIEDWTPSSISIVDVPAHPLCQFEVYDDDEEFVKKSIEIPNEGEIMVDETQKEETTMMTVSEGFFERLFNRAVGKSEEEPVEEVEEAEEVDIAKLVERIEKLEAEVEALKKEEETAEEEEEEIENPVEEAVVKNEDETSEAEPQEAIEEEVVIKSRSLDPDTITVNTSEKSLVERAGRNYNGMTW